jgi:uncharacterized protein Usg
MERDSMVPSDFERQISGHGLTTAPILYRPPDHRWLLQSYVLQDYDPFPNFPELQHIFPGCPEYAHICCSIAATF